MTGSSYIPIVVPIVAFVTMALWLGLVFYAAGHPGYRQRSSRRGTGTGASARNEAAASDDAAGIALGRHHETLPHAGVAAGPREHERIDEPASGATLR